MHLIICFYSIVNFFCNLIGKEMQQLICIEKILNCKKITNVNNCFNFGLHLYY